MNDRTRDGELKFLEIEGVSLNVVYCFVCIKRSRQGYQAGNIKLSRMKAERYW
jgi:hypothetical protein